jgi:hypothetical protein
MVSHIALEIGIALSERYKSAPYHVEVVPASSDVMHPVRCLIQRLNYLTVCLVPVPLLGLYS